MVIMMVTGVVVVGTVMMNQSGNDKQNRKNYTRMEIWWW